MERPQPGGRGFGKKSELRGKTCSTHIIIRLCHGYFNAKGTKLSLKL